METPILALTPDELLSTTRAVRRRLDLSRPVPRAVLLDCIRLAQQAPTGRNRQVWDMVFVTDPERRRLLTELWRRGLRELTRSYAGPVPSRQSFTDPTWHAIAGSLGYLIEHLHDVPVLAVPTIQVASRAELADTATSAERWGSVMPAVWSFMLAARSRGLGTVWTTPHLQYEREAADLLGIPYDTVVQAALIPVAYTIGTEFQPGRRVPPEEVTHWDQW